jgi:hypothetical protein
MPSDLVCRLVEEKAWMRIQRVSHTAIESSMFAATVREVEQRIRPRCQLPTWDSPMLRTMHRPRSRDPPLLAICVRSSLTATDLHQTANQQRSSG